MKMEMSFNMPNLPQRLSSLAKKQTVGNVITGSTLSECGVDDSGGTVDLSKINVDEETWLYDSNLPKSTRNLREWLYQSINLNDTADELILLLNDLHLGDESRSEAKNIDTRTFTRPKKRFIRPSIEKYNEELCGVDLSESKYSLVLPNETDSYTHLNGVTEEIDPKPKPLHFDLMQPSTSYYFDNILANAPNTDSFQNMSPPSLVNSMCSSTFANLMENSFIKNDPILREIRDTDYTESILREPEHLVFQSFTESCNSLNSDVPDIFLTKVSSRVNNLSKLETDNMVDFRDVTMTAANSQCTMHSGTYHRSPKLNNTFSMYDNDTNLKFDATFQRRKNNSDGNDIKILNKPQTQGHFAQKTDKTIEKVLNDNGSDLIQFSDYIDDKVNNYGSSEAKNFKRNSYCDSTGSNDNLDCMSNSSNSSKGEFKALNMDGINAIIERQERSLQIISTPKKHGLSRRHKLWEDNYISPIINAPNSDSDLSSSGDYKNIEPKATTINTSTIKKPKSLTQIDSKESTVKICDTKIIQNIGFRGSHPNLKVAESNPQDLQSNLYKPCGKGTNLNTMRHTLKGSYTSLKPISANLPVAPPIIGGRYLKQTKIITKQENQNVAQVVVPKVVQVPSIPRENNVPVDDGNFVKPHVRSVLPRPIGTGIPRPVSRIPAPRTTIRSNPKTTSVSQHGQGRQQNYGYF